MSRPRPSDNPVLFLFLVGGVTPSELRLIKEIVAAHKPGTQVSRVPLQLFFSSITADDKNKINRTVRQAARWFGLTPDSLEVSVEKKARTECGSLF